MSGFEDILYLGAAILACAACFGWANARWTKLPHTIALVLCALAVSVTALALERLAGAGFTAMLRAHISRVPFNETLMIFMLSFLLFAGALHLRLETLRPHAWLILTMATLGVLISTAIVGTTAWAVLHLLQMDVALPWCFVFGALISPTDPVAVLAILKTSALPEELQAQIGGEALFNDGAAVIAFTVLLAIAAPDIRTPDAGDVVVLLLREVIGGVAMGLLGGYVGYLALRSIDDYNVKVLITLALVPGIYALCIALHASGPLAVGAAGLLLGGWGRKRAAAAGRSVQQIEIFWSLLDEILNSILFLLIGFQMLVLDLRPSLFLAIAVLIPVVLLARLASVSLPVLLLERKRRARGTIRILTWAGLRGGVSVALALSLPEFAGREEIITITYGIVIVSIVGQGLSIKPLAARWSASRKRIA